MNYKKLVIYIHIITLTFIGCKSDGGAKAETTKSESIVPILNKQKTSDILGKWHWQSSDKSQEFTIKIKNIKGNIIHAQYCAVSKFGNRLDCDFDDHSNIKGKLLKSRITLEFYSFFGSSSNKGKAEIRIIDTNTIIWKVLVPPKGNYNCPKECILKKEGFTTNNFSDFLSELPLLKLPISVNPSNNTKKVENTFFYFEKENNYFELDRLQSLGYFKINNTICILYKFSLSSISEAFASEMLIMSSFKSNGEHLQDVILQGTYGGEGNVSIYNTRKITDKQIVVNKIEEHYGVDTGLKETIKIYKTQIFNFNRNSFILSKEYYDCSKTMSLNIYYSKIKELFDTDKKDDIYGYTYLLKSIMQCTPINKENISRYNDIAFYFEQSGNYDEAIFLLEKISKKNPKRVVTYINLGDSYWSKGNKTQARKNYNTYISLMKSQKKQLNKIPQRVYDRID